MFLSLSCKLAAQLLHLLYIFISVLLLHHEVVRGARDTFLLFLPEDRKGKKFGARDAGGGRSRDPVGVEILRHDMLLVSATCWLWPAYCRQRIDLSWGWMLVYEHDHAI